MIYTCKAEDRAKRVDQLLASVLNLSRSQVQRLIEQGLVKKNNQSIDAKYKSKAGEIFSISIPEVEQAELQPQPGHLDLLYEDACMLVLNKKAGELVHPGAGKKEKSLAHILLHHFKENLSDIGGKDRPGIVHRLDQDTSGVLVIAKTNEAHEALAKQFAERQTLKIYQAFVLGKPSQASGEWKWPVGRDPVHRQKMRAFDTHIPLQAREAHTSFKVLQTWPKSSQGTHQISLLELQLHTGRTHQIRVHALKAKCPIVGDTTYGKIPAWLKPAGVTRQLLHAWKLGLYHPSTQKWMEWEAPLPQDFKEFEEWLIQ